MTREELFSKCVEKFYEVHTQRLEEIKDIFYNYYGEERVDIQYIDKEFFSDFFNNLIDCFELGSSKRDFNTYLDSFLNKEITEETLDEINDVLEKNKNYRRGSIIIYVYFPEVTITNEFNKSRTIKDLYVKINLFLNCSYSGMGMLRSSYSYNEYEIGYTHSHVYPLSKSSFRFESPCLGRGPLVLTTGNLKEYDSITWRIFAKELDDYTKVESLNGGPHIKMSRIGKKDEFSTMYFQNLKLSFTEFNNPYVKLSWLGTKIGPLCKEILHTFIKYLFKYIEDDPSYLKLNIIDSQISFGITNKELHIKITNLFIKFLSKTRNLEGNNTYMDFFNEVTIDDNSYTVIRSDNKIDYSQKGKELFEFKGKKITLSLYPDNPTLSVENKLYLLKLPMVKYIITTIIKSFYYLYSHNNGKTIFI